MMILAHFKKENVVHFCGLVIYKNQKSQYLSTNKENRK